MSHKSCILSHGLPTHNDVYIEYSAVIRLLCGEQQTNSLLCRQIHWLSECALRPSSQLKLHFWCRCLHSADYLNTVAFYCTVLTWTHIHHNSICIVVFSHLHQDTPKGIHCQYLYSLYIYCTCTVSHVHLKVLYLQSYTIIITYIFSKRLTENCIITS